MCQMLKVNFVVYFYTTKFGCVIISYYLCTVIQ